MLERQMHVIQKLHCTSPKKWDITHTKSHWSNDDRESMIRYVEKVLLSYVESVRNSLLITQHDQMALAIFDVFKAHCSDKLLALHKKSRIAVVFVPASCTDKLQPLDQRINKKYKEELRKEFQMWFANMVAKKLSNKKDNDEICERTADIDLQTSVIKPLHAKWLIKCHETLERDHEFITQAFNAVGIPC